jgi:hypothetical protein
MMSAEQLDLIDGVFKKAQGNNKPFGGKDVLFTGDFLQLPPINGGFAFEADS